MNGNASDRETPQITQVAEIIGEHLHACWAAAPRGVPQAQATHGSMRFAQDDGVLTSRNATAPDRFSIVFRKRTVPVFARRFQPSKNSNAHRNGAKEFCSAARRVLLSNSTFYPPNDVKYRLNAMASRSWLSAGVYGERSSARFPQYGCCAFLFHMMPDG